MNENQQTLPLHRIKRPKRSLRPVRRNAPEYAELVESIRKDGVLQPILVRPDYCVGCPHLTCQEAVCECRTDSYDYDTVDGFHRRDASLEAGRVDIPAYIREMTDWEVLVAQIKCNAIRPKTQTFEYARRLKLLMEQGYTKPELSALIDKSPRWIEDQLQLNRLCEPARAPIERGEIKMTAALALANLPEHLQERFIDDAIAMPAGKFRDRAEEANRDFKAYLLRLQAEDKEMGAAKPTIRAINVLKRESLEPKNAKEVLKAMEAKTPRDGWIACLAWAFRLDPISVENRRAGNKERESNARIANNAEFHKMNREMIERFVNPQSSTGDYQNG